MVHTDFYWRPNSSFAIHAHVGRPDLTAAGASEEQESILLLLCCQAVLVVYYPLLAHDAHHIASHASDEASVPTSLGIRCETIAVDKFRMIARTQIGLVRSQNFFVAELTKPRREWCALGGRYVLLPAGWIRRMSSP
ncbi:hypothetical protein KC347_g22 [Hortaea werneckii]|nr:hypothetical protein KC347_g22 [Hortaea werneckii]